MSFQAKDLGKESMLLLTFDSEKLEGIYKRFYPVVWKVGDFPKTGVHVMKVTYTNQFVFSSVQVSKGKIADAETYVKIKNGERTNMIKENDAITFSAPHEGTDGVMQAWNKTEVVQNIAFGFMNSKEFLPAPVLFFEDVGDGSNVTAEFTPILRAYITSDYKENTFISKAIEAPMIWEKHLATLAEKTTWTLSREATTGHYKFTQA